MTQRSAEGDGSVRRSRVPPVGLVATALAAVPLCLIAFDAATGNLGAEPVEALMRRTGWWALTILLATLAVTPLRRVTGWNHLIKARRPLGLMAFLYAVLHFTNYIVIDQWFAWDYIIEDLLERPLITAGFTALILLLPLALTSTKGAIRRLGGKRWQKLHRLIYPAAALGVLHYYWLIKADKTLPIAFAAILVILLASRLWAPSRRVSRKAAKSPARQETALPTA